MAGRGAAGIDSHGAAPIGVRRRLESSYR
jgi:hypothetical protein